MNDDTHSELFEYALNHIDGITYTDGKRIMRSLSPSERILFRKRISEKYHNSTLTYQDLQMQSQFIDAHQDINNLDDIIMLHSHNFCEMIYINSGELEYILGSARYMVRSKDAIFIPAGRSHRPIISGNKEDEYYDRIVIWVNTDLIDSIRLLLSEKEREESKILLSEGFVMHLDDTSNENLKEYFVKICRESAQMQEGWQIIAAGLTASLIVLMMRAVLNHETKSSSDQELFDNILLFIDVNFRNKLSLKETALFFHVSERTLNNLFHTKMNTSFYQYVIQRRLIEAKKLIAASVPLSETARRTGFGDYAEFYRLFKKEFDISPSQYKDIISNN